MPALRVSLVAWLVFVSLPEQQRPGSIFRAETRTVMVNVAVFDRSGFIEGLGTKDFLVTDNGVNQTVVKVEMTSMNLDVVVATDQSGSLPQATASQLARDAHAVIELVGANDTLRQLTFDRDVRTTPLPPRPSTEGYVPRGDGGTALFDAITAAVLVAPDPTRQRLAIGRPGDTPAIDASLDGSAVCGGVFTGWAKQRNGVPISGPGHRGPRSVAAATIGSIRWRVRRGSPWRHHAAGCGTGCRSDA